jgi:hypothetical protein
MNKFKKYIQSVTIKHIAAATKQFKLLELELNSRTYSEHLKPLVVLRRPVASPFYRKTLATDGSLQSSEVFTSRTLPHRMVFEYRVNKRTVRAGEQKVEGSWPELWLRHAPGFDSYTPCLPLEGFVSALSAMQRTSDAGGSWMDSLEAARDTLAAGLSNQQLERNAFALMMLPELVPGLGILPLPAYLRYGQGLHSGDFEKMFCQALREGLIPMAWLARKMVKYEAMLEEDPAAAFGSGALACEGNRSDDFVSAQQVYEYFRLIDADETYAYARQYDPEAAESIPPLDHELDD